MLNCWSFRANTQPTSIRTPYSIPLSIGVTHLTLRGVLMCVFIGYTPVRWHDNINLFDNKLPSVQTKQFAYYQRDINRNELLVSFVVSEMKTERNPLLPFYEWVENGGGVWFHKLRASHCGKQSRGSKCHSIQFVLIIRIPTTILIHEGLLFS